MMETEMDFELRLIEPVAGAWGGVQVGETVPEVAVMGSETHVFRASVNLKDAKLPFRGPIVRKDGRGRFLYICWGRRLGQPGTEVDRRAKVYLETITQELVDSALAAGKPLIVDLPGKAKDGWPCCATVKPLVDWHLG